MKVKLILLVCSLFISSVTYAASSSLWGDLDEPLKDAKDAVREQMEEEAQLLEEQTAKAKAEAGKTVCEVLIAQPRLDFDKLNDPDLLAKLRTAMNSMPDEYKALVSTNDAMDDLYQQYRNKYIRTYCTK